MYGMVETYNLCTCMYFLYSFLHTCRHLFLSVAHCPSSFIEIGHSVQFVGLSSDDLTLSVCYENGNQTVMGLFDVPTFASPVSSTIVN